MSVAFLQTQVQRAVRNGYPKDGSKPLPRRVERLCKLVASEEYTLQAIADMLVVSYVTVWRTRKLAPVQARVAYLREELRASAYDAEPLVDKRNRVLAAASLARTLRETLERNDYVDTIAVTKQGIEIKAHDRWRTQHYLDALAAVHRMVDGDSKQGPTTTVNVGISMDDAVTRVQALLSRVDTRLAVSTGVGEGGPQDNAEMSGARSLTEYENTSPREAIEGEYEEE